MITIEINKKFYSIPQHWNELSEEQLLQVMDAMFCKKYDAPQLLLKLLKILTKTSYSRFYKWKSEEVEEYFYALLFLLKTDFEFTKQLIPDYAHGDIRFYGPADSISNMRMKEFAFSEGYFIQWADSEKKDEQALNELIAVLYREPKEKYDFVRNPDGDPRQDFNDNICSYNAKACVSHWPMDLKLAIATWYDGCRRNKVGKYPNVFGGEGEPAKFGLISTMLNVAKDGPFKDIRQVENEHVELVMMHLEESIEQSKKLEAQIKQESHV